MFAPEYAQLPTVRNRTWYNSDADWQQATADRNAAKEALYGNFDAITQQRVGEEGATARNAENNNYQAWELGKTNKAAQDMLRLAQGHDLTKQELADMQELTLAQMQQDNSLYLMGGPEAVEAQRQRALTQGDAFRQQREEAARERRMKALTGPLLAAGVGGVDEQGNLTDGSKASDIRDAYLAAVENGQAEATRAGATDFVTRTLLWPSAQRTHSFVPKSLRDLLGVLPGVEDFDPTKYGPEDMDLSSAERTPLLQRLFGAQPFRVAVGDEGVGAQIGGDLSPAQLAAIHRQLRTNQRSMRDANR